VHLGVADREEARISGQESKTLISTLPPRWFGKTLWGQRQYNPGSSRLRHPLVDDTITFNPIVDGKYEPNMRTNFLPGAGYNIFVDPGATKSQSSRNYHGIANGAHEWRLADALKYVCWESNPLEERILNPAVNGNGEVDGMKLDQVLFNMTLRTGGYLPETLDALLEPFGYTWFVDVAAGGKPQMHVMKLGEPWTNLKTYLYLQRPGSVVSIAESDTSELLALDIAHSDTDRINAVRTRGGRKLIEATFELIPGWDKQYDGYWHEDQQNYLPAKDEPAWKTSPHLQDVHRKWVLNEAGDYNTLRGVSTTDLSVLLQQGIAEVFQNPETWIVLPKRRRFHPTLTCDKNGDPVGTTHGVLVERWAWEQGSQAKWVPLNTEEDDHQSFCAARQGMRDLLHRRAGVAPDAGRLHPRRGADPRDRHDRARHADRAVNAERRRRRPPRAGDRFSNPVSASLLLGGSGRRQDLAVVAVVRRQSRRLHDEGDRPVRGNAAVRRLPARRVEHGRRERSGDDRRRRPAAFLLGRGRARRHAAEVHVSGGSQPLAAGRRRDVRHQRPANHSGAAHHPALGQRHQPDHFGQARAEGSR
jgi:hypothetical protein